MIPFNKPYLSGNEYSYIEESIKNGQLSGNGKFTKQCHQYFTENYNFSKCLLTTSCTDALEMSALLINVKEGDEIIMPSYTFVSTANAFVLRGAKIVFADSRNDHPGLDETKLEGLITEKTKAIVPVHYAGVSCNMEKIMELAEKYNLFVIEDAAQGIDSYYTFSDGTKKALGSIGNLGAFSFHETKNIISGEGGMLVVNDDNLRDRAEILWEKGTNRAAFWRGEVDKYGWIDIGSSYLPSELISAFLYAQLENLESIQNKRKTIWEFYNQKFNTIKHKVTLPFIPNYATNNGHMYYLICDDLAERSKLIRHLKENNIHAVFHYQSLHESPYFIEKYNGLELAQSNKFTNNLVRLPLHCFLTKDNLDYITKTIIEFYDNK